MKLRNIIYYLAVIVLLTPKLWAANTNPVVTNVTFSITGTIVTVHYDVTDAEQSTVTISMEVSSDGGATWNYNYGTAAGNIGTGVVIGTDKTITWTYPGRYNSQFMIRIIANDLVIDGGPCATTTVLYGGKTYHTVQIVNQCWLKENLDIGTRISGSVEQTNNNTIEKYCYNDSAANCTTYGGLYEWAEAVAYTNGATNGISPNPAFTGNIQGLCPTGWHLPTYGELQTLGTTINNNSNALKAVGQGITDLLQGYDGAGTNTSGFSGLLAGYRGYFFMLGEVTLFWSSTEYGASYAYGMTLNETGSYVGFDSNSKDGVYSVRCAKD